MIGVYDIPLGGKLPVEPTYLVNGVETPVSWIVHRGYCPEVIETREAPRIALYTHRSPKHRRNTWANTFLAYVDGIEEYNPNGWNLTLATND